MRRFTFYGWWLLVPACLAQSTTLRPDAAPAEDPQLRAEAVRLMERAVMLTTPVWPANEEFFNFRVLHPAPGEASEGAMKIGVKTRVNKRWEFTYGTYKYIRVQDGSEFATYRSESAEPAALTSVRRLVPAFHGRFDGTDMIRRIADATADDRPSRCIDFDTLKGDQQQSGQVCVDAQSGFLLSIRQGDETIRQSAYFRFNNAWLPGHIERWVANEKLIEIDARVVVRTEYPPEYFDYPADAKIDNGCREFHRAFADQDSAAGAEDAVERGHHGEVARQDRQGRQTERAEGPRRRSPGPGGRSVARSFPMELSSGDVRIPARHPGDGFRGRFQGVVSHFVAGCAHALQ